MIDSKSILQFLSTLGYEVSIPYPWPQSSVENSTRTIIESINALIETLERDNWIRPVSSTGRAPDL